MVALKSTRKGRKGRGNRGSILSAGSRGGSIEQPWERLSAGNVLESERPPAKLICVRFAKCKCRAIQKKQMFSQ